jgi:hypothetical protein
MIRDFIIKWPSPTGNSIGYAYFRKFSCPLEMYLFRLRHSDSVHGIACVLRGN